MRIICKYFRNGFYFLISAFTFLFLIFNFVLAIDEALIPICESEEKIGAECKTLSPVECRRLLENCENYYQEKSVQIEEDIAKTEKERKTRQSQIYILKKKIEKLDLQIQQSNLIIKDLTFQIKDTETSIEKTSLKIKDSQKTLANILQLIYEEDQKSLIEILLSEETLSGFFDNLVALENLNFKNQELLENIKNLKSYLENQKQSLDEEKADLERMVQLQILQREESKDIKKKQEYFLKLTEAQYQNYLKEKEETEKRAREIRARIFELIGVPKAPTFGEAYEIAKYVEKITGVRPAFVLAIMTQESNIGKNVGQCYLVDFKTGEGVRAGTGKKEPRTMNPIRDIPHFLNITKELGRDPLNTLVSCPMEYGWGGAMGPAQFIPSTWMKYRQRIQDITGKPADPWDIKDAFLAAALYLADYGATQQTYDAEWKAAMIYFSGTTNKKYRFYGDRVLTIAQGYEEDIKAIEAGGLTQI